MCYYLNVQFQGQRVNVGITIDMYYMSELYSNYSCLYDELDQNNVDNNQTFMDMLVLGTKVFLWHTSVVGMM